MFGAKYSRLKFWIISICLLIPAAFVNVFAKAFENNGNDENALVAYSIVFIIGLIWINTLANRIRDYGSSPWISLFALIPLGNIGLALYYGIAKSKNKSEKKTNIKSNDSSLTKAVYNHGKDIASEIKPKIEEYKEKHISEDTPIKEGFTTHHTRLDINEDEIYEKVMLEIEENKKVKSTWAKALAQSEGNKDKAEALYIKLRVENIKNDYKEENRKRIKEANQIEEENRKRIKEANQIEEKNKERLKNFRLIDEYIIRSEMFKLITNKGYKFIDQTNLVKDTWDDSWKDKRFQLKYNNPILLICEDNNIIEEITFKNGL